MVRPDEIILMIQGGPMGTQQIRMIVPTTNEVAVIRLKIIWIQRKQVVLQNKTMRNRAVYMESIRDTSPAGIVFTWSACNISVSALGGLMSFIYSRICFMQRNESAMTLKTCSAIPHDHVTGERLPYGRGKDGNRSSVWRVSLEHMLRLSATTAIGLRPVSNKSPPSTPHPCDHQNFLRSIGRWEVPLAASKVSLRPNRLCDHHVTSATYRWLAGLRSL